MGFWNSRKPHSDKGPIQGSLLEDYVKKKNLVHSFPQESVGSKDCYNSFFANVIDNSMFHNVLLNVQHGGSGITLRVDFL